MSEEFSIDWPHGHQTRDGRKARIICTDVELSDHPIVAVIYDEKNRGFVRTFSTEGKFLTTGSHGLDIINAPAPVVDWEKIARSEHISLEKISTMLHGIHDGGIRYIMHIKHLADSALEEHADAFK